MAYIVHMEVSGPAHVQNGKRIIIFSEKKSEMTR